MRGQFVKLSLLDNVAPEAGGKLFDLVAPLLAEVDGAHHERRQWVGQDDSHAFRRLAEADVVTDEQAGGGEREAHRLQLVGPEWEDGFQVEGIAPVQRFLAGGPAGFERRHRGADPWENPRAGGVRPPVEYP